ncbi:type II secretion system protein [Oceanobacillus sp. Castelsardo]|uniref:type II secretion system protein n=1 Tax=Oceanobacillus sp. Castelsardo TaxID=1851204 RepID=UPI0008396C55|nr:type II secretion system protein [Oceanobacillus sp. Castelsardo]
MKNRHFFNQKGLTLVELLAALGLFAVVIALSATVIVQFIGSNEKTSGQISLQQEANIAINELRNQYIQGQDKLCISQSEIDFTFENVKNGNAINECIEVTGNPLSFSLGATSHSDDSIILQTTFNNKKEELVIPLPIKNNDEGTETPKPPEDFDNEDNMNKCTFPNDVQFNKYVYIANGNSTKRCPDGYLFKKNAAFTNGFYIHNHNKVTVEGNLYVLSEFYISNHVDVVVLGNLYVEDRTVIKPNGSLDVKGKICQVNDINNIEEIDGCEKEIEL